MLVRQIVCMQSFSLGCTCTSVTELFYSAKYIILFSNSINNDVQGSWSSPGRDDH